MTSNIHILYEDNHLLVVDKPSSIPSQQDLTTDTCILDMAKDYIKTRYNKPGNVFAGLAHRLDRPVSGIVVIGKTSKGLNRMMQFFRQRQVEKCYVAIVNGACTEQHMHLENYLYKDSKRNVSKVVKKHPDAKLAIMDVECVATIGDHSLLKLYPFTGRSHQIRVQLAHVGLPIVGDVKYGGTRHDNRRAICLHSHKIAFPHPTTGEILKITSLPHEHHWLPFGTLVMRIPG